MLSESCHLEIGSGLIRLVQQKTDELISSNGILRLDIFFSVAEKKRQTRHIFKLMRLIACLFLRLTIHVLRKITAIYHVGTKASNASLIKSQQFCFRNPANNVFGVVNPIPNRH